MIELDIESPSYLNKSTSYTFGKFIGTRYPYLPTVIVPDTNPYWANEMAAKADYAVGGTQMPFEYTNWDPEYDLLAEGITNGEREAIAIMRTSRSAETSLASHPDLKRWRPFMTM